MDLQVSYCVFSCGRKKGAKLARKTYVDTTPIILINDKMYEGYVLVQAKNLVLYNKVGPSLVQVTACHHEDTCL